jgi:hypothetical protein
LCYLKNTETAFIHNIDIFISPTQTVIYFKKITPSEVEVGWEGFKALGLGLGCHVQ